MQLSNLLSLALLALANPITGAAIGPGSGRPGSRPGSPKNNPASHAHGLPGLVTDESALKRYGLEKGTPERNYLDNFAAAEKDQIGDAAGMGKHWVFYSNARYEEQDGVQDFMGQFMEGKHHEGIAADDTAEVETAGRVYDVLDQDENLQDIAMKEIERFAPDSPEEKKWSELFTAAFSWRAAQRAAAQGGVIRFVTRSDLDNSVPGFFWHDFEAYELTKPGSNVLSIYRYNGDKLSEGGKQIWKQGDPPMGKEPNFSTWKH